MPTTSNSRVATDEEAGAEAADEPAWGVQALGLAGAAALLAACGGGADVDAPGGGREQPAAESLSGHAPVYRFAKLSNGAYFYTGSRAEKDIVLATNTDMRYEGVAFHTTDAAAGGVPVYRFANLLNGGYFYTSNPAERDLVVQTRPDMRFEGSSFSVAAPSAAGAIPVYRLANLNNGAYLYTRSVAERDAAVGLGFWRNEGISFHTVEVPADFLTAETPEQAARFLLQAQFSASDEEIAAVRSMGMAAWLQAQMVAPAGRTTVDWLKAGGYTLTTARTLYYTNAGLGDCALWNQMLSAPDAVRKRMALALSEYFVTSINGLGTVYWGMNFGIGHYWDTLCRGALGNFRDLLQQVTLHPVMGVYLNTRGNRKEDASGRQPDENYAREVMQLFTIGLYQLNLDGSEKRDAAGNRSETYTQSDVSNLARVFTGYELDNRQAVVTVVADDHNVRVEDHSVVTLPMRFYPGLHSNLQASFLGTTVPANTDGAVALTMALDTLFNHPNVGPFFGRQMIQRLVTGHPSPAYVARVASAFNDNGRGVRGDLRAVFSAILLDDEARSPAGLTQNGFGKVREPMLRLAQWGRTFAQAGTRDKLRIIDQTNPADRIGQSPLRSSSVFNFFRPGYVPPSTAMAAAGATAPEFQLVNETTVSGYLNAIAGFIQIGNVQGVVDGHFEGGVYIQPPYESVRAEYAHELPLVGNSQALVARLNLLLCAGRLSTDTQALIISALNATPVNANSSEAVRRRQVYAAVFMVMASPEYLVQK